MNREILSAAEPQPFDDEAGREIMESEIREILSSTASLHVIFAMTVRGEHIRQVMPIPSLDPSGRLPRGVHDCSIREVEQRFGRFQGSDRRRRLWSALEILIGELRAAGVGIFLLIDGSFVTAKAAPEDIDLILVVSASHDFGRELTLMEYNVLSSGRVRRRHGVDLLVAREDSDQYHRYVKLFQQVRLEPDQNKGILRVTL
jgi:uncharacterized protein DUF6932